MKTVVRAATASRILRIPQQELRIGIQRGRFGFGEAVKNKGCQRLHYTVNLYKAAQELGIPLGEIEKRWAEMTGE
ncbi:hypothetical protein B5F37_11735 [Drancourtella sp. An210]|nr:hypothetical protein B5F37_11735 [Drancourtella sp. An210]